MGELKSSSAGATSTSFPAYSTPTLSQRYCTMDKSCAMKSKEKFFSFRSFMKRLIIWACTETSKEETGSSAIISSGSRARLLAMQTRCFCPPESSAGIFAKMSCPFQRFQEVRQFFFAVLSCLEKVLWIIKGSAMQSSIFMRGLRETEES